MGLSVRAGYERKAEEFLEFKSWLDNCYAVISVDVSSVHRVQPLEDVGKHYFLGADHQKFGGAALLDTAKRGEFTLLRYMEVLVLPADIEAELTLNDNKNDGIPLLWAGQVIRRMWIRKIFWTNLATSADPAVLLLKGLKFPQR